MRAIYCFVFQMCLNSFQYYWPCPLLVASSGAASSTRQGITFEEKTFVQYLHNISARPPGWNLHMYPLVQMGSSNDKGRLEQLGRN